MKYIIFFLSFALTASTACPQPNTWVKKMRFGGNKRERAVGFAIGSYGYICLGQDTAEQMHRDLWQYDPVFNTWTQKADFSGVGRRNAIAFVIDDIAYVGTGIDHSYSWAGNKLTDISAYNPNTNTWTPKASFPGGSGNGIYYATAFSANGMGYLCGGKLGPDWYSNELWQYNPNTDQWTQKSTFPGGDRYGLCSVVVSGKAYIGMGADHDIYRNDWWEYDPLNNSWAQKSSFPPGGRSTSSTFSINNRAYVLFGTDGGYKDDLWEYNPLNDSWITRAKFPGGARRNAVAFSIGTTAFAGTGKGSSGDRRNFYQYFPLFPDAISASGKAGRLHIFPNPSNGNIHIASQETGSFRIGIYDMKGRELFTNKYSNRNMTHINLSGLSQGTYMLVLYSDDKSIAMEHNKITIVK